MLTTGRLAMYLGAYDFKGDVDELVSAYDHLVAGFPPGMVMLQVCVRHDDGITVLDACPSRDDFRAFSTSDTFGGALRAVGLPDPTIREVGEVHATVVAPT